MDKCDLEVKGRIWTFFIHPNARDRYSITGNESPKDSKCDSNPNDPAPKPQEVPAELEYVKRCVLKY